MKTKFLLHKLLIEGISSLVKGIYPYRGRWGWWVEGYLRYTWRLAWQSWPLE